ncbi:UbiX family flavin prenyltransferase [Methanoregula sp.]|uniref:UbiX family flavin prenyltransferase n=1 Tax=Methanoregula sp. TaxID=2052170 RepID=UPI002BAFE31C|nr:UbiX family flavin prenyltransferase [Methanoregula sp.]HVP96439.1 UbiX family flavin prenyltransferase [Methanoregula sp.]
MKKEYVIGVTGASGACYARRLLEVLCQDARVHLIISEVAQEIARHERVDLSGFDAIYHDVHAISAEIASGSHRLDGMVIIPCSAKTLSAIASGYADNLITRTADVCLKERRKCILVTREMPLSRIHISNMLTAHDAGATIMPASPGFYHHPEKIDDLVDMVVARVLDHLGVTHTLSERWSGYDA